jgi:predicted Zn-dependent protease
MTSRIANLVDRAIALSKADACIVLGREVTQANVRWANNTSTTNGVVQTEALSVISIRDGRVGSVSRTFVPDDGVEDVVRESEAACEGRPEAEDEMPLIEGQGGNGPDAGFDADAPQTGIEVFDPFVPQLAGAFDRARSEGRVLYGYAEHTTSTVFLGTSTGLRKRHTSSEGTVECTGKPSDLASSTWVGRATADFTDVDVDAMHDRVAQRLAWSKNHIELPARRYEVILEPSATADMCLFGYFSASARAADEGRSVYSKAGGGNRIGEQMFGEGVTLASDPREPGMEVTPFQTAIASSPQSSVFDNGIDTQATTWVENGVLTNLASTRFWAQKTGGTPTPFISNYLFHSDSGPSVDEMIANTERALLVAAFWYIRTVDPRTLLLTGLTRDGVYLVENGEVVGAVNNYRFNESPVDMLTRSLEIGPTEPTIGREIGDSFPFVKMPPLRVEGFNMSSVSQAQ